MKKKERGNSAYTGTPAGTCKILKILNHSKGCRGCSCGPNPWKFRSCAHSPHAFPSYAEVPWPHLTEFFSLI